MIDTSSKIPPILFIHGAWHGKWCYEENFYPYFEQQGFETHALDLPQHGEKFTSNRKLRWLTIADYVRAVAEYATRFEDPPILVGHSMGGFVVQKYLESHSAAAGVLLASIPPRGVGRLTLEIARRHPLRLLNVNLKLSLAPLVETPDLARELFFSAAMPQDELMKHFSRLNDESYRAFLDYLVLNLIRPQKNKTPMLVMGAANDAVFTVREIQTTAAAYHSEAVIFPDMAHDMMLEPGWRLVADEIIGWVKQNLLSSHS